MDVRTRTYRSEVAITGFDGEVIDRGAYLVLRTPQNPGYYWGNILVFAERPRAGDAARWFDIHAAEFAPHPDRALIFTWDEASGAPGEDADFLARGMQRDLGVCLRATAVRRGPKHDSTLEVRALAEDTDWQRAEACLVRAFQRPGLDAEMQRTFVIRQLARYRRMVAAGLGTWFAAFVEGRAVGCLGLVAQGAVGRFQLVGTDPDFARRGVCSTLVYEAALRGLEAHDELLIVADATYHAAGVYRAIGFSPVEQLASLIRLPQTVAESALGA
jgi:hypothetical protein